MASFEKRGTSVRVVVRVEAGRKKTATFDTMKEARAWAQAMERKKLIGELKSPEDSITVGEMLESYLDDVASKTDGSRWNTFRIFAFQRDPIAKLQLRLPPKNGLLSS